MNIIDINFQFERLFPTNYAVVFLHAHPDDESFLSAGLINQLSIDRKCIVVYMADALVSEEKNTVIRQQEAGRACKILGVDTVLHLEFCEPKYLQKGGKPLVNQATEFVEEKLFELLRKKVNSPFILMSYDKNGGYGNEDHKILHKVGRKFFYKRNDFAPLIYEVTLNRDSIFYWLSEAQIRLNIKSLPKLSYWISEFGLPDSEINFCYSLTDRQIKLKREALSVHSSQILPDEFPLSLDENDFKRVFGNEFLRVVDRRKVNTNLD